MNKLLKIVQIGFSVIVNIVMLVGVIIVLAWILGGISPQTSVSKIASFFSQSWNFITGKPSIEQAGNTPSSAQLNKASQYIKTID